MKGLSKTVLDQIEQMAAEGRVTEGGKALLPGLMPEALPLDVDEKQFQAAVVTLAKRHGWMVFHPRLMQMSEPGYPDLTLVLNRVVFMELKVRPNQPTAEQWAWHDALKAAKAEVYIFYPEHWDVIVRILEGVS